MGKLLFYCMCFLAATTLLNAISIERCRELHKGLLLIIQHANKTHPQSFHVPVDVKAAELHNHSFWCDASRHLQKCRLPSHKHNCLESALICFRTQVHKLQEATGKNSESGKKGYFEKKLLHKVKWNVLLNQQDCTPCQNYTTHKPSVFLEKMDALLQRIIFNSGN